MGRPVSFTDDQILGALRLVEQGGTWAQAAAAIGISVSRLQVRAGEFVGAPYPSSVARRRATGFVRKMRNMPDYKPLKVLPAGGPPFPVPVSSMCLAKGVRGEDVLYVAAGQIVYRLEERDGESVFVPLRVAMSNADDEGSGK